MISLCQKKTSDDFFQTKALITWKKYNDWKSYCNSTSAKI